MENFNRQLLSGNICRFCLDQAEENGYVLLFTADSENEDNLENYLYNLQCGEFNSEDGQLPKWLCRRCYLTERSTAPVLRSGAPKQAKLNEYNESENDYPIETENDYWMELENEATGTTNKIDQAALVDSPAPESNSNQKSELVDEQPVVRLSKRLRRPPKWLVDNIVESPFKNCLPIIEATKCGFYDTTAFTTARIAEMRSASGVSLGEIIEVEPANKNKSIPSHIYFICEFCKYVFPKRSAFLKHLETHNECSYECIECLQVFKYKKDFVEHQEETNHTGVGIIETLPPVEYETATNGQVAGAVKRAADRAADYYNSIFVCLQCRKQFRSLYSARRHYKLVHLGYRAFQCIMCKSAFKTMYNFKLHVAMHTGEKNYTCEECQRSFKTNYECKRHSRVHTGEKHFTCSNCSQTFTFECNFLTHEQTRSGDPPHNCKSCAATFRSTSHLDTHHEMHLKAEQTMIPKKAKGKKASNLFTSVNPPSPKAISLLKPSDSITSAAKENKKTKSNKSVAAVAARKSSNKFCCVICQKQFKDNCALRKHERVHTGERPYKCSICSKTFSDPSNCKKHQNLHNKPSYVPKEQYTPTATSQQLQQLQQLLAVQSPNIAPMDGKNENPTFSVTEPEPYTDEQYTATATLQQLLAVQSLNIAPMDGNNENPTVYVTEPEPYTDEQYTATATLQQLLAVQSLNIAPMDGKNENPTFSVTEPEPYTDEQYTATATLQQLLAVQSLNIAPMDGNNENPTVSVTEPEPYTDEQYTATATLQQLLAVQSLNTAPMDGKNENPTFSVTEPEPYTDEQYTATATLQQLLAVQSLNIAPMDGNNENPTVSVTEPEPYPDGFEMLVDLDNAITTPDCTPSPMISGEFVDVVDHYAQPNLSRSGTLPENMPPRFEHDLPLLEFNPEDNDAIMTLTEAEAAMPVYEIENHFPMAYISYQDPQYPFDDVMTAIYLNI